MDDADRAAERQEAEMAVALASRQAAASAPPSDGRCHDCGEAIDPRRLRLLPHAHRCIHCQRAADRAAALGH